MQCLQCEHCGARIAVRCKNEQLRVTVMHSVITHKHRAYVSSAAIKHSLCIVLKNKFHDSDARAECTSPSSPGNVSVTRARLLTVTWCTIVDSQHVISNLNISHWYCPLLSQLKQWKIFLGPSAPENVREILNLHTSSALNIP